MRRVLIGLTALLLVAPMAHGIWRASSGSPDAPFSWRSALPGPFAAMMGISEGPLAAPLMVAHDMRATLSLLAGVPVPDEVPDSHLQTILHNSDVMGVPLPVYLRIIHHESRFDSTAHNPHSGTFGYMQMSPRTFRYVYGALGLEGGRTPDNNLTVGAELLRREYSYWSRHGDGDSTQAWRMALACYAVGDSLPRRLQRVPRQANEFVNFVMNAR